MKTFPIDAIPKDAQNFVSSRNNGDGTITLYYPGDEVPTVSVVAAPPRLLSLRDFRLRFTDAELAAILTSADVNVKLMLLRIQTSLDSGLDLDDPQIVQGLDYLVAQKLLAANRPAEIRK